MMRIVLCRVLRMDMRSNLVELLITVLIALVKAFALVYLIMTLVWVNCLMLTIMRLKETFVGAATCMRALWELRRLVGMATMIVCLKPR